jgi:tetratricopeptide (TPR) repeat protein
MSETTSRICPECGAELQEDDIFCPSCLTRLTDIPPGSAVSTSPPRTGREPKPIPPEILFAIAAILLFAAALLIGWMLLRSYTAERQLSIAEDRLRSGNLAAAMTAYDNVLRQDPNATAAYIGKGEIYYSQGQDRQAIDAFRQAVNLDPSAVEAWIGLGRSAYYAQEDGEAQYALEKATALDPDASEAYRFLGALHQRQGNRAEAITALSQAVQQDAYDLDAVAMLGQTMVQDNRAADALPHLERVFSYRPQDMQIVRLLSQAYNQTGRPDDSVRIIRSALEVSPDDLSLLVMFGEALYATGDPEAARAAMQRVIELSADAAKLARSSLILGQIARADGDLETAYQNLAAAVLLAPDQAEAKAELGWTYIDRGDCPGALPWLQAALEIDPGMESAQQGLQTCQ